MGMFQIINGCFYILSICHKTPVHISCEISVIHVYKIISTLFEKRIMFFGAFSEKVL